VVETLAQVAQGIGKPGAKGVAIDAPTLGYLVNGAALDEAIAKEFGHGRIKPVNLDENILHPGTAGHDLSKGNQVGNLRNRVFPIPIVFAEKIGDSQASEGSHHTKAIVPRGNLIEAFRLFFDNAPHHLGQGEPDKILSVLLMTIPGEASFGDLHSRSVKKRIGQGPGVAAA
jgi:hypothetical protein